MLLGALMISGCPGGSYQGLDGGSGATSPVVSGSSGVGGVASSGAASGSVVAVSGVGGAGAIIGATSGSVASGAISGAIASGVSAGVSFGVSGSAAGASAGVAFTGSASGDVSGITSGAIATGAESGAGSGSASGSNSASCLGPTRYIDNTGACVCAANAYSFGGGACICQVDTPTLCTHGSAPPACTDTTTDWDNCGGCGIMCKPTAACLATICGKEPTQLVAPAPGCVSMRVVYDSGTIYWSDMGHGTISSIAAVGSGANTGAVTTIASGLDIAAVQTPSGPLFWPSGGPLATALLVHAGTVYWIGASTPERCEDAGICTGGVGSTIMSATAGSPPKTLLSMSMDPGPSPVSATDLQGSIETPGQSPPILAIALSPDGGTLYFAAGTRFYSIPSSGSGSITYVGYTEGPEQGEPTAIAADDNYLYYVANVSGNVEILSLGMMCDPNATANEVCPVRIAESQGDLVYDSTFIRGDSLFWGNGQAVRVGSVKTALEGNLSGNDFPNTAEGTDITGFAVGTESAYFGELGADNAGYIEKGEAPPFDGDFPNAAVIARGQPSPTSFALDGARVYWTTSRCDIDYIADSPE